MSEDKEIGDLLALVVHDLRNPVATISANVSFVREVGGMEDTDVSEALDDVEIALADLTRGLEQLGWVGRWISGKPAIEGSTGDARISVEQAVRKVGGDVRVELPEVAVPVGGAGAPLARLVELLVRNAQQHARSAVVVRLTEDATIEVQDEGRAVGDDLREQVFTLAGQQEIKSRADGRYSRVVGLLAASAIAEGMGARLEADGEDGAAVFRIRLSRAK